MNSSKSRSLRDVTFKSVALTAISIAALVAAACEGRSITGPDESGKILPPVAPLNLAAFVCKATPSALSVSCDPAPDPMSPLPSYSLGLEYGSAAPSSILIGGQGVNVLLTSSNITNDAGTHHFAFDVTVKNLRPQPIGTTDGATSDSSLSVFFHSGPTTTGGTGVITVFNPTGVGTFTGAGQPFFKYGERLAQNQTSAAKNWILEYDATVTTFSFLLLVNANVEHPNGYIDVFASSGSVGVGSTLQVQDSVRDALGVATADQSETWSLSDSSKATIDAAGLLTGTSPGSVTVTATQGLKTGSMVVTVTGSAPAAVNDAPTGTSVPGDAWHTPFNTALSTPAVTANDNLGTPAATVASFGGGTLGGTVTTNAAGSTATVDGHSLTLNANGSFTYTPKTGFTGLFTTTYRITNAVSSSDATLTIAVGARPAVTNTSYAPTLPGNVGINTSTSTLTKVGATGDALTYNLVSSPSGTANIHADGTFDFKPNVGFTGAATITFNVTNGFATTSNATVSVTVGTPRIWFVASGGSGDGRYGTPLGCIVGASGCVSNQTLNSGDVVYIGAGTYASTGALAMTSAMRIIGQGASGAFNAAANANVTWPADAGTQPATGGARPVMNSSGTGVLTLNNGNTIRGVLIGNAAAVAVSGSAVGNLAIGDAAIVNANGRAIDLSTSGTLSVAVDSIVATGGTGNGISLANQSGSLTSGITKITNPTATGINVTNSAGFNFGTTVVRKTSTAGVAINLSTNSGTTTFTSLVDSTSSGAALAASSFGTLIVSAGNINAVGGAAIDATTGTFNGTLSQVNVSGQSGVGVSLAAVGGTLTINGGTVSGAAGGAALNVTGSVSPTLSVGATITQNAANRAVNIDGLTGGSVTITPVVTGGSSSTGININNTNANVTFSNGMNLGTNVSRMTGQAVTITNGSSAATYALGLMSVFTNNAQGLVATNFDGTLNASGAVDVSNSTAINIDGPAALTTLGLNFTSVNSSGGTANGISIQDTNGSFTINGDGTNTSVGGNGTGGTIANKSGADNNTSQGIGVFMRNVSNVTLRRLIINGTNQNYGIKGTGVSTFALEYSTVSGTNGTATSLVAPEGAGEGSIYFGNSCDVNASCGTWGSGITGTATFTNDSIAGGRSRNLSVINTSGTLNRLVISNSRFGLTQDVLGNQELAVESRQNGTVINSTVTGSKFWGSPGDAANFTAQQQTTQDVIFGGVTATPGTGLGNVIVNNHPQNIIGGGSLNFSTNGIMTFHAMGNTMQGADGSAVTFFKASPLAGTPSMNGFFENNIIGVAGTLNSGSKSGNGIFVSAAGTGASAGTMSYTITNNQIHQIKGNAHIFADNTGGNYTANFTIKNNLLDTPGANWFAGIAVTNGSPASSDAINVCADIKSNTLNLNNALGIIVGSSGTNSGHSFNLPGLATFTEAGVEAFLKNNNSGLFTTDAYADVPATFSAFTGTGTSCPTPSS